MKIEGKFAIKWNGKKYKAVNITRSKNVVVISPSEFPIHTSYTKDGKPHWTVEKKDGKQHIYFDMDGYKSPPINTIKSPLSMGTYAGFGKEYQSLPNKYDVIDLDAFNCKTPNVQVFLTPPTQESVDKIPKGHRGEKRTVKFNDVWVTVLFIDASQPTN